MPFVHNNPDDVSVGVSKQDTVDHARPTKVNVIGAGIPDIPAHVYQATFESNPNWSEFYASSKEILQYWKDIVAKYGFIISMGSVPVIPAISRAENIALLSLLHSASRTSPLHIIPTAPSSNIPEHSDSARNYELSVDKERSLVGTLAFLAQTEEDPNHIPAICVEQDTDRLNVLIAINKAKWSDGDSILHVLEERLNIIFAIMQTVLEQDPSVVEKALFTKIVDMCSSRILYRLGLRASRKQTKKSKKPIKEILQNVIRCAKQVAEKPGASESLQAATLLFRYKAREVASLIDSWQGHQTVARLGDVVKGINQLHQVNQLSDLVNEIPAPELQNEAKKSFLNTIGKVSRYAEAPRILRRIAKRFRVARYMTAVPVNLPKEAFCIPTKGTYAPDIGSSVARIDHQYSDRKRLNRVYHLLGYTEAQSASLFSEQVLRTLREAKIHAEIQLVIYCELQRPTLFPRVVCSSKDACFLCSTFISLHKQIHTPRCHGRLYPGWRLPSVPQVKELEERFNKTLENSIKESLSMLFSRQRKTTYPPPNESTLLTIPISETTKSDLTQLDLWQLSCERSIQLRSQMTDQPRKAPESGNPSYASIPYGAACEGSTTDLEFPPMVEGQDPDSKIISKQELSQGIVLHNSIDPGGSSACYIAGPIKLTIEYATGLEGIKYSVEWLTAEEMKDLQGKAPVAQPTKSQGWDPVYKQPSVRDRRTCVKPVGLVCLVKRASESSYYLAVAGAICTGRPDRDDELMVIVEMREEESRDITPPGEQRLWVFLNNEDSAHHAAGYIPTSADHPLAKHIVSRGLLTQVDTPDVFQSALQHIEQCISGHEHCKAAAHTNPLPTRVVDCTNPLKPKLWVTDGREGKYIALSYVWGEPQAHSTTRDRLEMYQGGIELSALPQMIQDAIRDSDEDKRNEIGNMRSIYSDAYLVIIAASAKKVCDGFLQTRTSHVSEANDTPLAFQLPGGRIGSLHLLTNEKFSGYYPGMEPVNTRGWCFQEHMLATRALVFASHTLQYHCRTNGVRNIGNSYNYSPDGTAGRVPGRIFSMAESMRSQGSSIQPPARTSLSAEEWKSTREAWFAALRNYTPRSVSHPADKLIAFAAIAETFHALCSETRYLAGLWEDTLLEDLLWKKPKPPLPRPEAYRAPSWSWASVDGKTTSALTTLYYSGCPA
ncbi:Heterokaryon incompatibility [Aspergillus oryzae]|uniref:Heterokaryon incompatibility n=2 Tax=Aspergillus subgen. Circumdati TaxID=2720871 RepID=A0A1S9D4I0_ASPOZ|nr:Heterokaryon incompatibility [Aspergillus oryzae]